MNCDVGEVTESWRIRMSSAHSPSFQSLHLRHNSFRFSNFPSLHLRHTSFSNPSVALPTSQFILQLFRCFTYVTVHSPALPLLHLRHSSFSNSSVASTTSQLILQPFFRFSYVTGSSLTSPGEPPMEDRVRPENPEKTCPPPESIRPPRIPRPPLGRRFSNCGPLTTCGSRDLPLWSFKKIQKKN